MFINFVSNKIYYLTNRATSMKGANVGTTLIGWLVLEMKYTSTTKDDYRQKL
jgi:Na+/phosphate symporter